MRELVSAGRGPADPILIDGHRVTVAGPLPHQARGPPLASEAVVTPALPYRQLGAGRAACRLANGHPNRG